jgi:hypothetical protein
MELETPIRSIRMPCFAALLHDILQVRAIITFERMKKAVPLFQYLDLIEMLFVLSPVVLCKL